MNEAHTGKILSAKTLALMSLAKSGENNPMFGRTEQNHPRGFLGKIHSEETIAKMREVQSSIDRNENNPMFGKTGKNHPMYGKTFPKLKL